METKFNPTCYTIARVVGDVEIKTGANGKAYRIVPVELLGGKKASVLCNGTPEIMSFVMVRVQHRETGFGYTMYDPSLSAVQFLTEACMNWSHSLEQ